MNELTEEQVRAMIEEKARAIAQEEIQKLISDAYTAPIELLQVIDTIALKKGFTKVASSTKTVLSATQAVNEDGVATYNVCKLPDGFFLIEGTNKIVPYYTS